MAMSSAPSTSTRASRRRSCVDCDYERDPRTDHHCSCRVCRRRRDSLQTGVDGATTTTVATAKKKQTPNLFKSRWKCSGRLYLLLYWHLVSLLLLLTLLGHSSVAAQLTVPVRSAALVEEESGGQAPDLEDPGGEDAVQNASNSSSLRVNPLLRHRRQSFQQRLERQICHVWTRHSPSDLCNKGRWARLRMLRELSLFSNDCENGNVEIGELLRLEWPKIKSEADLLSHTEHLRPGVGGQDCLTAPPRSNACLACFERMDRAVLEIGRAYEAFNNTLRRFDCMLAVDSASATRPFSPNGTCADCKVWYRNWLLVQLLDIWQEPPCINWCFYAQLACPYLATSRPVDYAGHPSFICRDQKIPPVMPPGADPETQGQSCSCFHPCDLQRTPPEPPGWFAKNKDRLTTVRQFDFFASPEHCWARRRRCDEERAVREAAVEGLRLPRGRESNYIDFEAVRPSSSSSQGNAGSATNAGRSSAAGYVDEAPAELFNQLGAWLFPGTPSQDSASPSAPPPTAMRHRRSGTHRSNHVVVAHGSIMSASASSAIPSFPSSHAAALLTVPSLLLRLFAPAALWPGLP